MSASGIRGAGLSCVAAHACHRWQGRKSWKTGFYSISGGAVDAHGKLYFVDHHQQRIYGWSREQA